MCGEFVAALRVLSSSPFKLVCPPPSAERILTSPNPILHSFAAPLSLSLSRVSVSTLQHYCYKLCTRQVMPKVWEIVQVVVM